MDKYTRLKEKFDNCEKIAMANVILITDPLLLRAFADGDCVLIDKEHGVYGSEELVPLTMACRAMGLPAIVRVEDSVYHLIAKAIDMGADGIMVPRVESLEQVKTAVEATHFLPLGRTGFGGWGILRDGETFDEFQRGRRLILQIESEKGLSLMEEIIEKYGSYVDAFVIGPNDFSIQMGVPRELDHPVMHGQYEKFFEICHRHHKSCGIYDPDFAAIERDKAYGANLFWVSEDGALLKQAYDAYLKKINE
ncbi:MAG: hypothetical protein IJM76_03900 [Lachnospiraceae bacterium]|nr:hypothetical protein [Lachnospiraceae bacterium]